MIKHAEVQNAYLQGRQAAMVKLANDPRYSTVAPPEEQMGLLAALHATQQGEDAAALESHGYGLMSNEVPSLMSEGAGAAAAKPEPAFWGGFAAEDMAGKSKMPDLNQSQAMLRNLFGTSEPSGPQMSMVRPEGELKPFSKDDLKSPEEITPAPTPSPSPSPEELSMYQRALAGLRSAGANQMKVLGNIGLTGQGLYDRNPEQSAYDPRQLATMQNLSRAGMLAGAGGGAYLGGMDPRAAAIASAGALGGGVVGGNLGQGINAALGHFGRDYNNDSAIALGGALGGLGGGLGAGYLA
jgi:hypothetical protein